MATKGGKHGGRMLVVAIDFGTTFSGYAFSFRHEFEQDPLRVSSSQWMTGSRVAISLKTSSAILFNQRGNFDSFGFEAEDKYSDLALDGLHRDWYYFSRFKMLLYKDSGLCRTTQIQDESGKNMLAIDVFSAAIRYLKDHVMRTVNERMYGIDDHEISWVLTVPAIWDDTAKQFMREAAEKAGICGRSLLLALEPEAASVFCKYLPIERIMNSGKGGITCFQVGAKYLVLDAGGGTVDITVHEVQSRSVLRELYKANGGPWGGTTIDQAFIKFIGDITDHDVVRHFRETNKDDYLDLLREFEVKKRTIDPNLDSKVTFKIPIAFHEVFREQTGKEIRENLRSKPAMSGKVTFAGDKLRVEPEAVKGLFRETSDNIVSHLRTIFKEPVVQGTDTILMVGGFSESPMLRRAVEEGFPDKRVVIPHEAGLAVLKGAVIFGHNSGEIVSRISKYTYGIKMYTEFIPGRHPESRKIIRKGKPEVRGSFNKLVEVGQSVSVSDSYPGISCVPAEGSDFCVKLFASPEKDPVFVDDPGCISIGEVRVDCLDHHRGQISSATVTLVFGGTELEVQARHDTTGELTTAKFDFLD